MKKLIKKLCSQYFIMGKNDVWDSVFEEEFDAYYEDFEKKLKRLK